MLCRALNLSLIIIYQLFLEIRSGVTYKSPERVIRATEIRADKAAK